MAQTRTAFVTVGTTKFEGLVECFSRLEVHESLRKLGIARILIQYGKGIAPLVSEETSGLIPVESFQFSPSIEDLMRDAHIVISHAGAGSIMEALNLRRPLLVVINETLMDNHQSELADALQDRGHLVSTNCASLPIALASFDPSALVPYPNRDLDAFPRLVDETMGFRERD